MEHNVEVVKLTAALSPLVRYLYKKGITSVNGYDNKIHVTKQFFKETFPVYETETQTDGSVYLTYDYNGVQFFCVEKLGGK